MNSLHKKNRGFTLIEMIVSIGLFTIVLFIASSAFLSVVNADRKSRATRLAMDNLTVSLEDMTRRMKTGYGYECRDITTNAIIPNCSTGSLYVAFTDQDGNKVAYALNTSESRIQRTIASPILGTISNNIPVTAPEIKITKLNFIVGGTAAGDNLQPYIKIFIEGTTGGGVTDANFRLQTMVTQRTYDI